MIPIRNAVPSRYPPAVAWMLIATNSLVFLFQDSLSPDELELFLRQFALIPARYSEVLASGDSDLAAADLFPFFSMMFLHGGWLHLILNMWTLWLFGPTIEDRLGHGRYLVFYLACGFAASITHVSAATCGCFRWRGWSWLLRSCSSRCFSKSTHMSLSASGF